MMSVGASFEYDCRYFKVDVDFFLEALYPSIL